ncbi:ABC transporter permease [Embleya sp. NPDC059237]|uniref:ABC transporter permease n=1 Tax=Embleya sp. NPDC059237 TaxID=3346784 RepID=UPI0036A4AE79
MSGAGIAAIEAAPVPPSARRRTAAGPGPGLVVAGVVLAFVALAALWPDLLTTRAPDAIEPVQALSGPSAEHWFGTDQLGRDIYSRIVDGARPSLEIGIGATVIAVAAGSILGVVAATAGRVADELIMRITDVFLAFPGLILAMVLVAVLGPGTGNAMLAISCSLTPGFVRLARGQALVVREADYVRMAIVFGRSRWSAYRTHLLPNTMPPLLVLATVNIGTAILAGSALSFLGLGPKDSSSEWGSMLSEGRDYLGSAWATAVFPGLAISVTVVAINVVGRGLRQRFDGRSTDGD